MARSVRLFMLNRSQALRLPKEFQMNASEVFLRRQGDELVLSVRPADWSGMMESGLAASSGFMAWIEDLRVGDGAY